MSILFVGASLVVLASIMDVDLDRSDVWDEVVTEDVIKGGITENVKQTGTLLDLVLNDHDMSLNLFSLVDFSSAQRDANGQ